LNEVENEIKSLGAEPLYLLEALEEELEESSDLQRLEELATKYEYLKNLESTLGEVYSKENKTLYALENQSGFTTEKSNTDFENESLDSLLSSAFSIIKLSGFNNDTIDDSFSDYSRVAKVINELENVKNAAIKFPSFASKVESLILDLNKILNLAQKNDKNKELKNLKENAFYEQGVDAVHNDLLPVNTEIEKIKEIDPSTASILQLHSISNQDIVSYQYSLKEEFTSFVNSLTLWSKKTFHNVTAPSAEEIEAAFHSPSKVFAHLLAKIENKEKAVNPSRSQNNPVAVYLKDYDIVKFLQYIEEYEGVLSGEELRKLMEYQSKISAVHQAKSLKSSSINEVDLVNQILEFAKKENIVPSSSQLRVVRELLLFKNAPYDNSGELFKNVAALKAPAGAGKSLVVSKLFKKIANLDSSQIYTAAPKSLASKNIQTALDSPYEPSTVESLISTLDSSTLPSEVTTIVIDEVSLLSFSTLYDLGVSLTNFTRKNPLRKVKIIFLYDSNQLTAGSISQPAIEAVNFSTVSLAEEEFHKGNQSIQSLYRTGQRVAQDKNVTPFVQNITQISPLSTVYRAEVNEVADFQNLFKSDLEVSNVDTSTSVDPNGNIQDILGAFAETKSSIVSLFNKSVVQNSARSRAIIVDSLSKQKDYLSQLPNAQVLLVGDSIGITLDEVYVDIQTSDQSKFNNPSVYNQAMYTALSRAKLFAYAANIPSKHRINPSIKRDSVDKNIKEKIANLEEESKIKIDIFNNLLKQSSTSKIEEALPIVEALTQEESFSPVQVLENVTTSGEGFHSLFNVSSEVFEENPLISPIQKGEEVFFFKQKSGNLSRVIVARPLKEEGTTYAYQTVAILSQDEVPLLSRNLQIPLDTLEGQEIDFNEAYGRGVFTPLREDLSLTSIVGEASDLQYIYDENTSTSLDKNGLQAILDR
jgi:hypothetical protein